MPTPPSTATPSTRSGRYIPEPEYEWPMLEWRKELGLTQKQLALMCNLSELTIVRNEQMLYPEPSDKIISKFNYAAVGPYGTGTERYPYWVAYQELYSEAQRYHRSLTDWTPLTAMVAPVGNAKLLDTHPFKMWRESLGFHKRLEFCRAGCLPPSVINHYEAGRQATMPAGPKHYLGEFTGATIMERLDAAGKAYYWNQQARKGKD